MAKKAFLTGATGHIGFRVLALLLSQGYHCRISSRKLSTAAKLKELPSIAPYADNLEVIEIPDFFAPSAFDDAVKDVDFVFHIASPIPDITSGSGSYDVDQTYISPAVTGTTSVLTSASKSPTVKRVVITSSVAIIENREGADSTGPNDLRPMLPREMLESSVWAAYRGSKIAAYNASVQWMEDHKPNFDLVHVLPAYVQGKNEPVTTAQGLLDRSSSNTTLLQYVLGGQSDAPAPLDLVHVEDVAKVHVAALDSAKVNNGERLIANYQPGIKDFSEIDPIVGNLFPAEVKSGLLPLGGKQAGRGQNYDASIARDRLGVKFQGVDEMVKSLFGQYVELKKQELKN